MELDNIKELWQTETVSAPEISLEKQKEIRMPLEKIRKNMRMEFWSSLVAMILILPTNNIFSGNPFIHWSFMGIMFFVVGYFFIRFYSFYKKISVADLTSYESILRIRYELKSNIDLYKSYYISSVPIAYIILLLFLQKHDFFKYNDLIMSYGPFIVFFGAVALTLGFGKWWWDRYYNNYLKELDKILKQFR